jgi:hypothetical protein
LYADISDQQFTRGHAASLLADMPFPGGYDDYDDEAALVANWDLGSGGAGVAGGLPNIPRGNGHGGGASPEEGGDKLQFTRAGGAASGKLGGVAGPKPLDYTREATRERLRRQHAVVAPLVDQQEQQRGDKWGEQLQRLRVQLREEGRVELTARQRKQLERRAAEQRGGLQRAEEDAELERVRWEREQQGEVVRQERREAARVLRMRRPGGAEMRVDTRKALAMHLAPARRPSQRIVPVDVPVPDALVLPDVSVLHGVGSRVAPTAQ